MTCLLNINKYVSNENLSQHSSEPHQCDLDVKLSQHSNTRKAVDLMEVSCSEPFDKGPIRGRKVYFFVRYASEMEFPRAQTTA